MKTKSFTRLFVRAVWPSARAVMCWNGILRSHIGLMLEVYWVQESNCGGSDTSSTFYLFQRIVSEHLLNTRSRTLPSFRTFKGKLKLTCFHLPSRANSQEARRNPAEVWREAKQKRTSHRLYISINSTRKIIYKLNSWGSGALFIEVSAEATEC